MYARATIFRCEPARVDAGIAFVRREVQPVLDGIDGCTGLSLIVDREAGRCIATSAWHDEQSLVRSERHVGKLRARGAEVFGTTPTVQVWEIAAVHRVHEAGPGACVRATWARVDPWHEERSIDLYRSVMIPSMEELPGFLSASLFVDRDTGRSVSNVTYASREAMDRSRLVAAALRRSAVEENDVEVLEVREFDLVLAHLRVPELV